MDDWSDGKVVINEDGSFSIAGCEIMADPIQGQTYTRYYMVDGINVGVNLPEDIAKHIEGVAPTSFQTDYETDEHIVIEIWET